MPSPFPGMNPWLERRTLFPDFHNTFVVHLRGEINRQLPPGYFAGLDSRIVRDDDWRIPDVALTSPTRSNASGGSGAIAELPGLETIRVLRSDPLEEYFVSIWTADDERLVTAVEMLSRTNKAPGKRFRDVYRTKQREYQRAGVNLVELDFLRSGKHTTTAPVTALRRLLPKYAYHVCVSMPRRTTARFVKPFRMSDVIPTIGIPLDDGVGPIVVDLGRVFHHTIDSSGLDRRIDYSQPCDPPLTPEQQTWADGLLPPRKGT